MKIHSTQTVNAALIRERKVAIIGYGNQGAAHAQNLRDSGVQVIVGARADSKTGGSARAAQFDVMPVADAVRAADVVMLMAPDEKQAEIYAADIAPHLRAGQTLGFCHGFAVHFGFITPRADVDVILIAPKGPGTALRSQYLSGQGTTCLAAVAQNPSGHAMELALSYAAAISGGDAGILETTFGDECETDLFGEQAVLCGGIPELIKAGYDTLVEAGYAPELAYFECVHEAKLIVDLIHGQGMAAMRQKISNTAEYGGFISGERLVNDATRAEMKKILAEIRSGEFARAWMNESRAGNKNFQALRDAEAAHGSEAVGAALRAMMSGAPNKKEAA